MSTRGNAMWFWTWRSAVLLGCVTATVLLSQRLGDPWDVYLPLVVALVVLPPVVQRWRARYRADRGSGPSGQDGTD
ncbi:hypothetical protein SK571_00140 [Lentzea sp. BCCO 10_0798]|uniref:MYXO-CTERM domain-containing protein n=1 Tax=Lentzea kristufekii TaxID=3095430 RepID=A0ABU4TIM8_9PSEU|nr:hypothetical protein [Lentzea sp. BCCO 10_0798]